MNDLAKWLQETQYNLDFFSDPKLMYKIIECIAWADSDDAQRERSQNHLEGMWEHAKELTHALAELRKLLEAAK